MAFSSLIYKTGKSSGKKSSSGGRVGKRHGARKSKRGK